MSVLASIDIDWTALGKAAYVSAIAGFGVCLIAGFAVMCSLLAARARTRTGGDVAAGAYMVVTGACVLALAAIIVYGIYLLQK